MHTPSPETLLDSMTCVSGPCEVGHMGVEPLQCLGLEAHPQVPSHQLVLLVFTQERGKPIQKQLLHCWFSYVLHPAAKPSLEGVRVIDT